VYNSFNMSNAALQLPLVSELKIEYRRLDETEQVIKAGIEKTLRELADKNLLLDDLRREKSNIARAVAFA
jgi:hypothetical protein